MITKKKTDSLKIILSMNKVAKLAFHMPVISIYKSVFKRKKRTTMNLCLKILYAFVTFR